jgi:hypothetical protein
LHWRYLSNASICQSLDLRWQSPSIADSRDYATLPFWPFIRVRSKNNHGRPDSRFRNFGSRMYCIDAFIPYLAHSRRQHLTAPRASDSDPKTIVIHLWWLCQSRTRKWHSACMVIVWFHSPKSAGVVQAWLVVLATEQGERERIN